MLNLPDNEPFGNVLDVGIAIRTVGPERAQVHIGMLYKTDTNEALNLNLREHLDLRNEAPSDQYRWMQIQLDEINRRVLASLCALIASKCTNIPYGFTYNGNHFTPNGDYVPRDLGHGLTCATFVMAVFETHSIPLLLTQEWTVADLEDQGWQMQQVGHVRTKRGEFIANAISAYVGHPRYKPEHVAAGAIDDKRPLGRTAAIKLGKRIMRDLARSY